MGIAVEICKKNNREKPHENRKAGSRLCVLRCKKKLDDFPGEHRCRNSNREGDHRKLNDAPADNFFHLPGLGPVILAGERKYGS